MGRKAGKGAGMATIAADIIRDFPTLSTGQCCSLKVDDGKRRVWLCRVAGGVTIEELVQGRWITVSGGCQDTTADF